jgi:hypothetical protein
MWVVEALENNLVAYAIAIARCDCYCWFHIFASL